MSSGFIWRAGLVTVVGVALGVFALRLIDGADGGALLIVEKQTELAPRLALIRQADTGELVSLQIAPFEVGPNEFRVTLLDPVGRPQQVKSARLRFSRLEMPGVVGEVDAAAARQSRAASFAFSEPGWWAIDVTANARAKATFYLKLDQRSHVASAVAPPDYPSEPSAQQLFEASVARYGGLSGLKVREELTSGDRGVTGFGVWFVTNIDANREGYHATTASMAEGGSEIYSDSVRQCFRQGRDNWRCSAGPAPIGLFDLYYLRAATGFEKGREEVVNGEPAQVIFFYVPSQPAWHAWWIGEESHNLLRRAMVANGHFMLDRYTNHDAAVAIQPRDLPAQ